MMGCGAQWSCQLDGGAGHSGSCQLVVSRQGLTRQCEGHFSELWSP